MAKAQLPPDAMAFAKAHIVDLIESGRSLPAVIAAMRPAVNWHHLQKWRQDDPAFHEAIKAALEQRGQAPYYSDSDIAHLKGHIVHLVAEEGHTLSDALRECGVGWRTLATWRKTDLAFDQDLKLAQEYLTEREADNLKSLHESIQDARVAKVASDNLKTWIEWRNAKFRPKAPGEETVTNVIELMRAGNLRWLSMSPAEREREQLIRLEEARAFVARTAGDTDERTQTLRSANVRLIEDHTRREQVIDAVALPAHVEREDP